VADAEHLWTTCQAALQTQVSETVWRSTFQDISAIDADGTTLLLAVPNAMVKDRVENRYLLLVEDVVRNLGGDGIRIEVAVRPDAPAPSGVSDPLE
jgi:chromosomal replication initiation ATPase DnaA